MLRLTSSILLLIVAYIFAEESPNVTSIHASSSSNSDNLSNETIWSELYSIWKNFRGLNTPTIPTSETTSELPASNAPPPTSTTSFPILHCGDSILKNRTKEPGANTTLGDWPWLAALYFTKNTTNETISYYRCTGSLISEEWILTSTTCVQEHENATLTHVRLGGLNVYTIDDETNAINVSIKQIIKEDRYEDTPARYDIALIRLNDSVEFTDFIRPICLHTGEKYFDDTYYDEKKAFVAGWGATALFFSSTSDHLQEIEVKSQSLSKCVENYRYYTLFESWEIPVFCAQAQGEKDNCGQGFGGAPLMFEEDGYWYQGGIVTYRYLCGGPQFSGLYTHVANYTDWIIEKTGIQF